MTIEEIERWVGQALPEPYRAFLGTQEESFLVNDLILIYGHSDFIERNETAGTKEYCPGHITVGDDSGGSQFVLALNDSRLFWVDAGAQMLEYFHPVAEDFGAWLAAGCPLPEDYW